MSVEYNRIAFGLRVQRAGYSQSELARRIGATHQSVSRLLHGLSRPRRRLLSALSSVLRCCPAEIIADFYGADFDPRLAAPRMEFDLRVQQCGLTIRRLEQQAGVNGMVEQWIDCGNIPFAPNARKVAQFMDVTPAQIIVDLVCNCRNHERHVRAANS